jgi:hypothetical protein
MCRYICGCCEEESRFESLKLSGVDALGLSEQHESEQTGSRTPFYSQKHTVIHIEMGVLHSLVISIGPLVNLTSQGWREASLGGEFTIADGKSVRPVVMGRRDADVSSRHFSF